MKIKNYEVEDYIEDVVYCVDSLNEEMSNTMNDVKMDFIFYRFNIKMELLINVL